MMGRPKKPRKPRNPEVAKKSKTPEKPKAPQLPECVTTYGQNLALLTNLLRGRVKDEATGEVLPRPKLPYDIFGMVDRAAAQLEEAGQLLRKLLASPKAVEDTDVEVRVKCDDEPS